MSSRKNKKGLASDVNAVNYVGQNQQVRNKLSAAKALELAKKMEAEKLATGKYTTVHTTDALGKITTKLVRK